jgi:hypothetical protein
MFILVTTPSELHNMVTQTKLRGKSTDIVRWARSCRFTAVTMEYAVLSILNMEATLSS